MDDHRVAEAVDADQPREWSHALQERPALSATTTGHLESLLVLGCRRTVELLLDRRRGTVGLLGEVVDQRGTISCGKGFELGERHLGLEVAGLVATAGEAERHLRGALGGVVEEPLVDVPNLLDVKGAEREPPRLHRATAWRLHLQELECFEEVQDRTVAHRERVGGGGSPSRAVRAPLEEREAVRVEQPATVRRNRHALVAHATMDGTEGC